MFQVPYPPLRSTRAKLQHLRKGSAAIIIGAATIFGSSSAIAANECGVAPLGGTVTCAPAANPYAGGITYVAPLALTVAAPAGIVVTTTAPATNGVTITGAGANTLTGAATVTTSGAGSTGVFVSGVGAQSVSVGAVTSNGGSAIISSSPLGQVSISALSATTTALNAPAILVNSAGSVSVATGFASATTGNGITASSTANNAAVTLTGGNSISTLNTGVAIVAGTTANLTVNKGASLYGGTNGATITSATGATINNAGTVGGGTYAVATTGGPATINNMGTLNGAVSMIGGNGLINNSGTFNAIGTSVSTQTDLLSNTGIVTVGATATAPATVIFAGLGRFNNAGLIDLRNGRVGDILALGGTYQGSGNAQLGVDIAPGATVPADRLLVTGAATGSTGVLIALPAGTNPIFNTSGTVIVQAGVGSLANAFVVAPGSASVGLVRYDVTFNAANNTYAVASSPNDTAYNLLTLADAERNLWEKSADAISTQFSSRRDALWSLGDGAPAGRFWVNLSGSRDNVHGARDFGNIGHVTDTSYQQDYYGGQAGLALTGGIGGRGGFSVGLTGGYINSNLKLGRTNDGAKFDAVNGGVYANFTSGNVFANAIGKYDYYWVDVSSASDSFGVNLKGHSIGARGEIGIRLGSDSLFLEPVATASWVQTRLNNFNVLGTNVSFDNQDGFRGKLGGRIGGIVPIHGIAKMSFYAGGAYVHQFSGYSNLVLANPGQTLSFAGYKPRDYGEGRIGINVAQDKAISGFFEGTYTRTFGSDNGSQWQEGAGGRVGISLKF